MANSSLNQQILYYLKLIILMLFLETVVFIAFMFII